jgi:catechol 2,3-dioxygenase-like lactoylglutathione lyase family enzyme
MMRSGLRHVALFTQDPDRLFDFYRQSFGFELLRRSPSGSLYASDGLIMYALLKYKEGMEARWVGYDHFGFHVPDLEEIRKRVFARHPDCQWAQRPRDGRYAEYRFFDPDGHPVDVSQEGFRARGDLTPPTVRHLAISATDPARSADFYRGIFDLDEAGGTDDEVLRSDGVMSFLIRRRAGAGPCRILHIGLEVEDPRRAAAGFAAKRRSGCGEFTLFDPDGNEVELASSWKIRGGGSTTRDEPVWTS